ncbi:MAG: glucose 1-dehydrogenase [Gammaproteobacteria bacterium]|nr:glucose 1-dehydrogenase [Gammaproteobacteria bacterium]
MAASSSRLAGKVAIVTGAASGIGRSIAVAFASEGARLTLVDRDPAGLAETARLASTHAIQVVADVTNGAAMADCVATTLARHGGLTTVVTAAGLSFGKRLTDITDDDWDTTLAVNVTAAYRLLKHALPAMITRGGGSIVTIASQLAIAGGRNNCAYVTSKGAVISMTKSIAIDYAADGIRANAILPGATETPMLTRAFARRPDPQVARDASRTRHAMQRFGKPEEIAAAAVFLASDEAAFVTGVALPVDGGWLAA